MITLDRQKPRIGILVRILISLKMVKATAAVAAVVVVEVVEVEEVVESVGELVKAAMELKEVLEEMKTAGTIAGTRAEALIEVTLGIEAFDESL